jgi:hypothetical protein
MNKGVKIGLLGFLTWAVPFVASWPFYTMDGQPKIDIFFIKTILMVVFSIFGIVLLLLYFKKIDKNYVREGFTVGLIWLAMNWILDLTILVPMAKMGIWTYFSHIGLRYLMIPTMSISLGVMGKMKSKT